MSDDIDREALAAHAAVNVAQAALDAAMDRRCLVFALANEKGKTTGDVARLVGIPPMQVRYMFQKGHRTIRQRRARHLRSAA